MVLAREEEAEVDKLVEDFGDVVMDANTLQNDDLLVDEPGQDAEIIDAISQLSPANAVNKQTRAVSEAPKEPEQSNAHQMKKKSAGSERLPPSGTGQNRMGVTADRKKSSQNTELKGAQASKKLNALRGRPSPRKKASGNQKNPVLLLSLVMRCLNLLKVRCCLLFQVRWGPRNHPVRRYEYNFLELSMGRSLLDQETSPGATSFFCTIFSFSF